jgi:hypothetical protein
VNRWDLAARPRWRGQHGRLEVWYATLTDSATGSGFWIHGEVVSPTSGRPYARGWLATFPADGPPAISHFGQTDPRQTGEALFAADDVVIDGDGTRGSAGETQWDLSWRGAGSPLWTFPRWAWNRELLPGAQVLATPSATISGTITSGGVGVPVQGTGGLAHIYGHGNAHKWGWLHADLGGGAVLELVTAVSRRGALRRLPPLAFLRLRVPGHKDWPRDPILAVPFLRTRLELPRWTVAGVVGRRRVRIEVTLPEERCLRVPYTDPDGSSATCVNTERADASVVIEHLSGGRQPEFEWRLRGTAHAEVGLRP